MISFYILNFNDDLCEFEKAKDEGKGTRENSSFCNGIQE